MYFTVFMNQIVDFFQKLFDPAGFPARWNCGKGWTDFHGWLYIISDLLIWSAYFAIPVIIISYNTRRKDVRFQKVYLLFAGFILTCGITHLLDAIVFWYPVYRLSALALLATGLISWLTVYHLIKLLPVAFTLKTSEELEVEIAQRKMVEIDLEAKITQMNEAQAIAIMGSWEWDVVNNKLSWSASMFRIYDLLPFSEEISYERYLSLTHPDDKSFVDNAIKQAFTDKKFVDFYHRVITPAGNIKTLQAKGEIVVNSEGKVVKMIGTEQDVSEQKKMDHELLIKSHDLEEINIELQKFAYVASHDLQEPLRKINTFLSRLENESELIQKDEKSVYYIHKIKSSATRMQQLMLDILNYSRLTSASVVFEKTDLFELIQSILIDMEISIQNTEAIISVGSLPTIDANESQFSQLFQNLIANAIKFRKPGEAPIIEINAELINGSEVNNQQIKTHYKFSGWAENYYWDKEQFCKITVRDKGIGLAPEYYERIFTAFERLHNLSQYEGTGIGLAICKKIVDFHHGNISVDCSGNGTVFTVIIPTSQLNFVGRMAS